MVSSFLGCFSLSIIYYLVGIVYSLAAILSFAFWCLAWGEPYREWYTIILLSGNTIVFGLPALCWAIDQIRPAVKYKRIFRQLYFWLTLIWVSLIGGFLVTFNLFYSWFVDSTTDAVSRVSFVYLLIFYVVAFPIPTYYIAKCIDAYIDTEKTP